MPSPELAHDRKQLEGRSRGRWRLSAARHCAGQPELEVLVDREIAVDPPPLRHQGDSRAARSPRAPALAATGPSSRRSPEDTGSRPMIASRVVVFPAPFGPISPTISPSPTSNDNRGPPVRRRSAPPGPRPRAADRSRRVFSERRSRRGMRRRRRGLRGSRPVGRPRASGPGRGRRCGRRRPSPSAMLWSIRSTPAPYSSRTERTTSANDGHLCFRQARRRLVHEHEPRPRRERAGHTETALVAVRRGWRPARPRTSSRPSPLEEHDLLRSCASRGDAPVPSAATSTFSRTERPRNAWLCWKVRVRPAPAAAVGGSSGSRRVRSSSTEPLSARSKPVSRLTSVDFPAPFGPIRPTTSWSWSSRVDAGERLHALEGPRDSGGPEGVSGPPAIGCLRLDDVQASSRSWERPSRRPCRRTCALLSWILITRYRRPKTECRLGREAHEAR